MRWIQSETNGHYFWTLYDYVRSNYDFEKIEVDLISDHSSDLNQFDHSFIESIIGEIDLYLTRGIDYIQSELRRDPQQFMLNDSLHNDVEKYAAVAPHEFPVSKPHIIFYPDSSFWLMRFSETAFPAINDRGIALFFNKDGDVTDFIILPE